MIHGWYICVNTSFRSLCYPNPEHHQHVPGLPQPLPERQMYPHAGDWIPLWVQHGLQVGWKRRVHRYVSYEFLKHLAGGTWGWRKVHELYVLSSRWWWMWEKPVCTWRMCEHPWVVHLSMSSWIPDYCNQDRVPRSHINTQRTHILYICTYFKRTYVFTVLSVCARFGWVCCQRSYLQQRALCEHWRKLPLCL